MTYLAAVTDALKPYSPLSYGAVGLLGFCSLWLVFALSQYWRASAAQRRAETAAMDKWRSQVDSVNPLASEFNRLRLRVSDITHPITQKISGKRFADCELMGPANLAFLGGNQLVGTCLSQCDVVVVNSSQHIQVFNAVALENTQLVGGVIWRCTIFIRPELIGEFQRMGAPFLSFTGDPTIDTQQPTNTAQKTLP